MGEARLGGVAEGTVQRRREESGNSSGDTQGSPVVPLGPRGRGKPAGTASAWQGLLRDHHLRWRRDSLTQHMETKLLREAITFHFPGL